MEIINEKRVEFTWDNHICWIKSTDKDPNGYRIYIDGITDHPMPMHPQELITAIYLLKELEAPFSKYDMTKASGCIGKWFKWRIDSTLKLSGSVSTVICFKPHENAPARVSGSLEKLLLLQRQYKSAVEKMEAS